MRKRRSISLPIALSSLTVALSIALLVGWIYVILKNISLTQQVAENTLLMSAGIFSLVVIMTVLVLFTIFLAREIQEVRRQTGFIDSVTHELRSPLAAIRLGLETLAREGLDDGQRDKLRDMMLDDVERLTGFIEDILQASRLEQREQRSQFAPVTLLPLAERVAAQISQRYREPGRIALAVDAHIALVTDAPALEVVLKNLFDNACKYSAPGTPVVMRAALHEKQRLVIQVQDQGVGIPKKELRRVFDRFYRVSSETIRKRSGTGLGLFVVSSYVKRLGGSIRALSEGEGQGSTLEVTLPVAPEAAGATLSKHKADGGGKR